MLMSGIDEIRGCLEDYILLYYIFILFYIILFYLFYILYYVIMFY